MITILLVVGFVIFGIVLVARVGIAVMAILWQFGPVLCVLAGIALILHLVGAL